MTDWWRNTLGVVGPLTLDMLKAEFRKSTVCVLCGLAFEAGERIVHLPDTDWLAHRECPALKQGVLETSPEGGPNG